MWIYHKKHNKARVWNQECEIQIMHGPNYDNDFLPILYDKSCNWVKAMRISKNLLFGRAVRMFSKIVLSARSECGPQSARAVIQHREKRWNENMQLPSRKKKLPKYTKGRFKPKKALLYLWAPINIKGQTSCPEFPKSEGGELVILPWVLGSEWPTGLP